MTNPATDVAERLQRRAEIMGDMDAVLIALVDGRPVPIRSLTSLPPWRAVMLARVAHRAEALTWPQVHALTREAERLGGDGTLLVRDEL